MILTKQQFIKSNEIIINALNNFLRKLIEIEQKYEIDNRLSSNSAPLFSSLQYESIEFASDEEEEGSYIYNDYLYGMILTIQEEKNKIEDETNGQESLFWTEIKDALLLLDIIFWQKPSDLENPIISVLHRIWFGSSLPENYQEFVLNFKKHNPHFKIILWTDFDTITSEEYGNFRAFCNKHNITLENIREHKNICNYDLIIEELDAVKSDPKNFRVHCVRASDLSRVAILIDQGGLYTDTDTDTYATLPEIDLPLGFLITKASRGKPVLNKRLNFAAIGYDFIAALPQNNILILAAEISRLDYTVYHENKDTRWQMSKQPHIHLASTTRLTGSSIFCALNYLLANNQLPEDKIDSLFYSPETYMPSYYHKSWLSHLDKHVDEIIGLTEEQRAEEQQSLENFLMEIDEVREKAFPTRVIKSNSSNLEKIGFFSSEVSQQKGLNFSAIYDALTSRF